MSDHDTSTQESIAPEKHVTSHAAVARRGGDWEQVGRRAVATLLEDALDDLQRETELAIEDVRRGEDVTVDHVHVLRECLDAYEHAVEAHLAAVADDAEPWSVDSPAWTEGERPRFSRGSERALDLPPRNLDRDDSDPSAPSSAGVRSVESDD